MQLERRSGSNSQILLETSQDAETTRQGELVLKLSKTSGGGIPRSDPFGGRRSNAQKLHTFCPINTREGRRWTYSSTKIGGHALDHKPPGSKLDDDVWGLDPMRRFGGLSVLLLQQLLTGRNENCGEGGSSMQTASDYPFTNEVMEREEEVAAYSRYVRSLSNARSPPPPRLVVPILLPPHQPPPPPILAPPGRMLWGSAGAGAAAGAAIASAVGKHQSPQKPTKQNNKGIRDDNRLGESTDDVLDFAYKEASEDVISDAAHVPGKKENGLLYSMLQPMDIAALEAALGNVTVDVTAEKEDPAWAWAQRLRMVPSHSKLHRYKFVKELGRGAHGTTLLVRQRQKDGALLVLKESEMLQEAVNEARLLSLLGGGEGVVSLHDFFVEVLGHKTVAYLELEYCSGGDLSAKLEAHGSLSVVEATTVALGLCMGLARLHRHGIVHRDLKPSNVLLSKDGRVYVADLGVSTRLSPSHPATVNAAGSMPFMAPEVRKYVLGGNIRYGLSSDIWAIGALIYAMTTGEHNPSQLATTPAAELAQEIIASTGSNTLGALALKALGSNPSSRPNIDQMIRELENILIQEGGSGSSPTKPLSSTSSKL